MNNHVYPFIRTVQPCSRGCFQHDSMPSYNIQIMSNGFLEYKFTVLTGPPQSPDYQTNREPIVKEWESCIIDMQPTNLKILKFYINLLSYSRLPCKAPCVKKKKKRRLAPCLVCGERNHKQRYRAHLIIVTIIVSPPSCALPFPRTGVTNSSLQELLSCSF